MKYVILIFLVIPFLSGAQSAVTGSWKTIDDETGKEKSVVEIFERNGLVYGKIVKLYPTPGEPSDPVCDACDPEDARYKKKIIGMEILMDMKKSGSEYADGTVLYPKNGKVYTCKIWLENGDLKIRGYWGPFFRTQTWKKVH
jgi:uncharacterized protein (DUF2147 family)